MGREVDEALSVEKETKDAREEELGEAHAGTKWARAPRQLMRALLLSTHMSPEWYTVI